jgi:hypothetical protein
MPIELLPLFALVFERGKLSIAKQGVSTWEQED